MAAGQHRSTTHRSYFPSGVRGKSRACLTRGPGDTRLRLLRATQQIVSIGLPPGGGFALTRLEAAMIEGGRLATHFLGAYRPPR